MPEQSRDQPPARDQRPARERWARHWVRAHVWTGVAAGLLVAGPTSLAEIAVIPPALVFAVFVPWTWRLWGDAWRRPVLGLLLLFAFWLALGLAWSPDPALGLEEFGNLRFFAVVLLLIPAMRLTATGRSRLIAGLAAGFLVGHVVQALNAWAVLGGGPESLEFGRSTDRLSGWWDPAVAGTVLTAALGLHLPPALMGTGRTRRIGLGGAAVTMVGLLATGSRGGWIASALLCSLVFVVAAVRAARLRRGCVSLTIGVALLVIVLASAAFVFRDAISARIDLAREQMISAAGGDYEGTDGERLRLKRAALDAFAAHPIAGVGTGGFGVWDAERGGGTAGVHGHAHDTLLHVAASNGAVGVVLLVAVAGVGVVRGLRWTRVEGLGSYAAGPVFALLGLVFTTPFDTLHVSGSAAAVTGFVLALCAHPPGEDGFEFIVPIRRRTGAGGA